ncbi:PP2C family protein-serine/threonine phosphatase [Sinorhizobium fredii]|uniref:PP2C family protein-serine/threonine phosphatase n=1 Tax=Rhizobium fredii TaxID=380 RepID=UPI003519C39D
MIYWNVSAAQHVGGRRIQEDSVAVFLTADRSTTLGVVADGLGGHGSGEVASRIVIDVARDFWGRLPGRHENGSSLLDELIEVANQRILEQQIECGNEARTTVCCALVRDGEVNVTSIGDSRAYLLRRGREFRRLTRDHSVTEMLLATGEINEEAMRGHPDSSRLTQSLGSSSPLAPFRVATRRAHPGDVILLCSDGLWQVIADLELASALKRFDACTTEHMVQMAATRGGTDGDNVSAVVLKSNGTWFGDLLLGLASKFASGSTQ